jgi:putative ABC transport system permease protein
MCEAWESVNAYRLRSLLTMLGIIIGVCAVVLTLAIGDGIAAKIQHSIQKLGSNILYITPDVFSTAGVKSGAGGNAAGFTLADAEALKDIPSLAAVAPVTTGMAQIIAGPQNWNTSVTGSTPDILTARGLIVSEGDMFTDADVHSSARVAVLGQTVADSLFPDGRAVGSVMSMRGLPLRVIGVLKGVGQSSEGRDQDDSVLVPVTTAQKQLFGAMFADNIFQIVVRVKSARMLPLAAGAITDVLRERKHVREGAKPPFTVRNPVAIAEAAAQTGKTLSFFLAVTAAITLVVGGIGIMNIMLVSVTERTREIGVRKAIGASAAIIMAQFLAEAVALSLGGCAPGIALGFSLNHMIARGVGLNTHISLLSMLISVSAAAVTGIVFGFFPALKAARLQPAEALRA